MKRNELDPKYTWKLEHMYATDEDWEKDFRDLESQAKKIKSFEGKLAQRDVLLEALRFNAAIEQKCEFLFCYARMRRDQDGGNQKYVAMTDRALGLISTINTEGAYFSSEVSGIETSKLNEFIADKDFADFDFMLKEMLRKRKHILSDKEEKLLSMADKATDNYSEIFNVINNVELGLPTIEVDGKQVKLTHGTYALLTQHRDQEVRRHTFESYYSAYKAHINAIANTYAGSVKSDNFFAKARGYDDCLSKSLDNDGVPVAVYNNLIEAVNENLEPFYGYLDVRRKALGVDKLHLYDMNVPIVADGGLSLSYEDAFELVLKGVAPLGKAYVEKLVEARDTGWIDVMENEGKRSGAYSWGSYGSHPYVLLNYSGTVHDIFTVAHELGHAMHSYYSDNALPYSKAQYTIFVAEVASTVNEVLLLKHLLSTTTDKNLRRLLLCYYVDMFRTTIFRQTMFAQFEKISHDMELNGEPLTVNSLSEKYYELNKKYNGEGVELDDDIRYEWARIPHFYTSFYVYKYATGITSAVNIVKDILTTGNTDRYMRFLSAGGSDTPYNILKNAGVDLATKTPYEVAMNEFKETIELLKKEFEA